MELAGKLLARRRYSRGELRLKISKIAIDNDDVEAVLDRLEQLKLLNDSDYAYNFALSRVTQKGWGPNKVYDSLLRRCVAQELAQSAIDRVRLEVSDQSALTDYLRRHFRNVRPPTSPKEARKLIAHLRQRGYRDETILGVLRQLIPQFLQTGE